MKINGYRKLTYLQGNGSTTYINTGIYPKSTTRVVCKILTPYSTSGKYNGWGSSGSAELFSFGGGDAYLWYGVSSSWVTRLPLLNDGNVHIFDLKSGSQKIDNVQYSTDTIGSTATSSQYMYLYCLHCEWTSSPYGPSDCKIYYCQIYDGTTLVRNFIPVERESDNVLGLYDLVNNVFYTNAGSGTFIKGDYVLETHVNPEGKGTITDVASGNQHTLSAIKKATTKFQNWLVNGYTQLEYIESSGTQKIEFTMPQINSANVKVEAHCEWVSRTSSSQNVSLFYFSASSGGYGYGFDINNDYGKARFYVATSWWDITELALGTPYTIETIGNTLKINGTSYAKSGSVTFSGLARIFAGNGGIGTLKISSYKVWNNDTLIFDFIPVIRHSDGQIGMLDLVHFKFYGNSGTGVFTGGSL